MQAQTRTIGLYQPYPHTFGGAQSIVIKLARSLPSHGYRPIVISPEEGSFTHLLKKEGVEHFVSDPGPRWHLYGRGNNSLSYLASPARVAQLVRYWFRLRAELKRHGISLLHCNDYRAVMLAAPAARLARIPAIWHMHGFIPSPVANLVAAHLVQRTVPVSRGMLDYLSLPHWAFGRCVVINNGMAPPFRSPQGNEGEWSVGSDSASSQTPPLGDGLSSPDPPIVLAAGALHPRKGYETLIHAFSHVIATFPQAECWIAGREFNDGAYANNLRQEVRRLRLENHVKFLGHADHLSSLMRRCQLLAIPSRVEAFGMVAVEAMLAGKPVVACRTGGLPEIIEHRQTGFLVDPEDAQSMGQAIIEILSNHSLAREMGDAGKDRALNKFTLKQMSEAFAAFYDTLLQPSSPRCPLQTSA